MKNFLNIQMRKAFEKFKKQYPSCTSTDWQSWVLGYQACMEVIENNFIKKEKKFDSSEEIYTL